MKKLLGVSIVVVGVMFLSSPAFARPFDEGGHGRGGRVERGERGQGHERRGEDLGLTEEQSEALKNHKKTSRAKMKEARQKVKELRDTIKEELDKDGMSEETVRSLAEQLKIAESNAIDQRINSVLEVKKILTPEQYEKFRENMREKRGEHKGPDHRKSRGGRDRGPEGEGPPLDEE